MVQTEYNSLIKPSTLFLIFIIDHCLRIQYGLRQYEIILTEAIVKWQTNRDYQIDQDRIKFGYNSFKKRIHMGKKRTTYKKQDVPFFIKKLLAILDDVRSNGILKWNETKNGFVILNQEKLSNMVLPEHFNHQNITSFIRQLNLYGFHKIEHTTGYFHEKFDPLSLDSLRQIKRISKDRSTRRKLQRQPEAVKQEAVHQYQQLALENQSLKKENELLKKQKISSIKVLRQLKSYSERSWNNAFKKRQNTNQVSQTKQRVLRLNRSKNQKINSKIKKTILDLNKNDQQQRSNFGIALPK